MKLTITIEDSENGPVIELRPDPLTLPDSPAKRMAMDLERALPHAGYINTVRTGASPLKIAEESRP